MDYGGRPTMINVLLLHPPTFYMCSLKIPVTAIDNIDRVRKHCLWRGSDLNAKGCNLAAWNLVCKPKHKGGLGVINLQTHNEVLLMKNLRVLHQA